MAVTVIKLPQVGESVTEGIIGQWLKQPGDHVNKYEPLVEVMTDKVNMEVPSPYAGVLQKTLVAEGDTVPMGQPIAEMEADEPAAASQDSVAEATRPGGQRFEFVESVRSVGPTGSGEGGAGRPDALREGRETGPAVTEGAGGARARRDAGSTEAPATPRLSPIVRRLVNEHNVDVRQVRGTGIGGRITKQDVLAYVTAQSATAVPAVDTAPHGPRVTRSVPLTPLRKTIAEHLSRSVREIPAAWTMVEVDVTGLVRHRALHREAFERRTGVPLTYVPYAAYATANALRAAPLLNAGWDADRITLNDHVHLGVAVSTDEGLYVPVLHDVDLLGVEEIAREVHRLAEAARSGALTLREVQGGTFTLNNTGALGSVVSVPIINHPQAAIMTMEAIIKRPVVVKGDAIAVRSIMNLCLTFDHRVCDGADAGRFLADVRTRLESIDESSAL